MKKVAANTEKKDMTFLSLAEFKKEFGIAKIDIKRNPETDKLFGIVTPKDGSDTYTIRVQQDWETAQGEIKFMCEAAEDEDSENYCAIKAKEGLESIETL